jgi:hypothetical protein
MMARAAFEEPHGTRSAEERASPVRSILGLTFASIVVSACAAPLPSPSKTTSPSATILGSATPATALTCQLPVLDCQPALIATERALVQRAPPGALPAAVIVLAVGPTCVGAVVPMNKPANCPVPPVPAARRVVGNAVATLRASYGNVYLDILQSSNDTMFALVISETP